MIQLSGDETQVPLSHFQRSEQKSMAPGPRHGMNTSSGHNRLGQKTHHAT
jgi:hypothetical protein